MECCRRRHTARPTLSKLTPGNPGAITEPPQLDSEPTPVAEQCLLLILTREHHTSAQSRNHE